MMLNFKRSMKKLPIRINLLLNHSLPCHVKSLKIINATCKMNKLMICNKLFTFALHILLVACVQPVRMYFILPYSYVLHTSQSVCITYDPEHIYYIRDCAYVIYSNHIRKSIKD